MNTIFVINCIIVHYCAYTLAFLEENEQKQNNNWLRIPEWVNRSQHSHIRRMWRAAMRLHLMFSRDRIVCACAYSFVYVLEHRCSSTLTQRAAAAHRTFAHGRTAVTTYYNYYHYAIIPQQRVVLPTPLCYCDATASRCSITIGKQNYRFGFPWENRHTLYALHPYVKTIPHAYACADGRRRGRVFHIHTFILHCICCAPRDLHAAARGLGVLCIVWCLYTRAEPLCNNAQITWNRSSSGIHNCKYSQRFF